MLREALPETDLRRAVELERLGQPSDIRWPAWVIPSVAEPSLSRVVEKTNWNRTLRTAEFHDLVDWPSLGAAIAATHRRAGTLTTAVQAALALIAGGEGTILRIAHTPDWLPYRSVALLPLVLDELARNLRLAQPGIPTVQIFLVVEADDARDSRMRWAAIPDLTRRNGELAVGCGVSRRTGRRIAASLPSPDDIQLALAVRKLSDHFREHLRMLGVSRSGEAAAFMSENLVRISEDLSATRVVARSLSEFNTTWLSRLVNGRWGLPTLFVRQAVIAPYLDDCTQATATHLSSCGHQQDGFWLVCISCGSRMPAAVNGVDGTSGECPACSRIIRAGGKLRSRERPGMLMPRLAAEVALDDLLWNAPLGASYIGSTSHVLQQLTSAEEARVELLWMAPGTILGAPELINQFRRSLTFRRPISDVSESLARMAKGQASIAYDLLYDGHERTLERWRSTLRSRGLNVSPQPTPGWLSCEGTG